MEFFAYGHPNIRATHITTLEFTKDKEVSLQGDCIVAVNAQVDATLLKKFIIENKDHKIKITLILDNFKEDIVAELNQKFNDTQEIIIRKSDFSSQRTFAIKANKAACDLNRDLIKALQNPSEKIIIRLETV